MPVSHIAAILAQVDSKDIDTFTNVGAMGLLGLIVGGVFWLIPKAIAVYESSQTANRNQLATIMEGIKQDRHADRELSHVQMTAFQLEVREQRDLHLAEAKSQRDHDEVKTDRLIALINENQKATIGALDRLEESHRLLADAIRSNNPRNRSASELKPHS